MIRLFFSSQLVYLITSASSISVLRVQVDLFQLPLLQNEMGFPVLIFPFCLFAKGKKGKNPQSLFLISAIVFHLFHSFVLRCGTFNFLKKQKCSSHKYIIWKALGSQRKTNGKAMVDSRPRACKWNENNCFKIRKEGITEAWEIKTHDWV